MIEARHLVKFFGEIKAVDDISFGIEKGEILGFLGPNAAGKSTTMRMITGFLPPSSGTAVIGGCDIARRSLEAREKIGYLPENAPVYPEMTVVQFLDFCAQIRGFLGREKTRSVETTIERCFLKDVRHQTVGTLSKGFKQRVCFAQAILHDPEYLVLDEPTDGLDPNQKHEVRTMIREMGREKAIILSTHILEEVDAVCTRAIIIAQGRIVSDDTPERLRAKSTVHGAVCVTLQADRGEDPVSEIKKIPGVGQIEVIQRQADRFTLRIFPVDHGLPLADQVVRHLTRENFRLESIYVEQGRLDEVFRAITLPDENLSG